MFMSITEMERILLLPRDTSSFSFWKNWQHTYQGPGTYTSQLIVTGTGGFADTMLSNTVVISKSCGPVSGSVYLDATSHCTLDAGESVLEGVSLTLT